MPRFFKPISAANRMRKGDCTICRVTTFTQENDKIDVIFCLDAACAAHSCRYKHDPAQNDFIILSKFFGRTGGYS
jgi:hypothetical protein